MRAWKWLLAAMAAVGMTLGGQAEGLAGDPSGLVALKQAGIGDVVLAVIVEERVLETGAFSVAELVALKDAGVGDGTLAAIVKAGSFSRMPEAVVYGVELEPFRFADIDDVVRLKAAGVSDEVIRALVVLQSERADTVQRREAFEMLKGIHIRVDERGEFEKRDETGGQSVENGS
jgi:hypothetical protein